MSALECGEQGKCVRGDVRSASVARSLGGTSPSNEGVEDSTKDLYRDDGGES